MCMGALIAKKIGVGGGSGVGAAISPVAAALGAFSKKKKASTAPATGPTSAPAINSTIGG